MLDPFLNCKVAELIRLFYVVGLTAGFAPVLYVSLLASLLFLLSDTLPPINKGRKGANDLPPPFPLRPELLTELIY